MASCFPRVWAPIQLSYFTAVTSLVLALVICIANALVITAVICDPFKKLRTPFSYFLVNLASCDLMVGLITLPVSVAIHFSEARGFVSEDQLLLLHITFFVSSNASILSLAMLSFDRFVAIKWPIRYRNSRGFKKFLLISCMIWGLSSALIGVYLQVDFINYLMVFCHVAVGFTLLVLSATYYQVNKILRGQWKEFRLKGNDISEHERQEHWRVSKEQIITKTFLYIVVGFLLCCTLPVIGIYILQFCDTCDCRLRHVLRDLQFIFISVNSAINPLVAIFRMAAFRHSIIAILCRCRQRNVLQKEKTEGQLKSGTRSMASSQTNLPSGENQGAYVIAPTRLEVSLDWKTNTSCSLVCFKKVDSDFKESNLEDWKNKEQEAELGISEA